MVRPAAWPVSPAMTDTAIVWFRRDLRVHDHPSLTAAARAAEHVVPVFVLDEALLGGRFASGPRARFLLGCLRELREALRERGADLVVRSGDPARELAALARETGAGALHFASDVSGFAMARDRRVCAAMAAAGVEVVRHPGLFVADVGKPAPRTAGPTRSSRRSGARGRSSTGARCTAPRARSRCPRACARGRSRRPTRSGSRPTSPTRSRRGSAPGASACTRGCATGSATTPSATTASRAAPRSSRPTCTSAACRRASSSSARATPAGQGPEEFVRQLCWRDFYAHVLLTNPGNARRAHRREMDELDWEDDEDAFEAWCEGRTGFPVVDAGMRQLRERGWIHNRAR